MQFDLVAHLKRQIGFSKEAYGPARPGALEGVIDHIENELIEVKADPTDLKEWVDLIILSFDGAWKCGYTAEQICVAIEAKQTINENRTWPDWRTCPANKAIEHDRSKD